jgi:hypothetical protein
VNKEISYGVCLRLLLTKDGDKKAEDYLDAQRPLSADVADHGSRIQTRSDFRFFKEAYLGLSNHKLKKLGVNDRNLCLS